MLWETATGKPTYHFAAFATNAYISGAFSPDGRTVATGCGDGGVE